MAIYHLHCKVFSRKKGHSAVASAAYRSGECLADDRYDKQQDYTRRGGVVHTAIISPENAPEWVQDRARLWNAVEATEKRKDSQLAREVEVAIPRELNTEQRIELVREFVSEQFVRRGMVADVAIHEGKASDGGSNPHAHIMLTMREISAEGFGKKVREWNDTHELEMWREGWAGIANRYIAESDAETPLIDHRSYAEQGVELKPTIHLGKDATAMERAGIETERGTYNRVVEHINRAVEFTRVAAENMKGYAVEFYSQLKERFDAPQLAMEQGGIERSSVLNWYEDRAREPDKQQEMEMEI